MNVRRGFLLLIALTAVLFAGPVLAEELPLFARLKDVPLNENPVMGYVIFGNFPDGQPMIRAVTASTAVFIERQAMLKTTGYTRNLLDCRNATLRIDAFGDIESLQSEPRSLPLEANPIKRMHPRNLQVFKRVCNTAGLRANW
ncbi:hypothetical protein PCA31118_05390 [Pandoraea captiosa]|uniref:Uncharacterized protein n=1 Tax=Pandoraea captiosa TaxID=2508302 RepID=A0A5E5AWI2_9BURK|nr:hypothetical protein [Pandoraea captiosa]VVE77095.1 hypothetical protein PCA31118_05390 [Pandoraea captiosa]